MFEEYQIV